MSRERVRAVYSIPTDMRAELEQLIEHCVAENSGRAVGAPSVRFDGATTTLEVDQHEWWTELMKIRYPQLVLLAVNRCATSDERKSDSDRTPT